VAVLERALTAPPRREHTLAGECTTVAELAREVTLHVGSSSRVTHVPLGVVALASRVARLVPLPLYPDQLARLRSPKERDASSARAELGFEPRTLAECLDTEAGQAAE
jgi:nucleoside-diphosphate-sugar epimerase